MKGAIGMLEKIWNTISSSKKLMKIFDDEMKKSPVFLLFILVVILLELGIIRIKVVDESYKKENGHFYKVYSINKNWDDAKKECRKEGGHLVTITSELESVILDEFLGDETYWMGASKDKETWKWVTGEKFLYTNWDWNEPNDLNGNEDVLVVYSDMSWNDANSNTPFADKNELPYICEWEHKINIIISIQDSIFSFGIGK